MFVVDSDGNVRVKRLAIKSRLLGIFVSVLLNHSWVGLATSTTRVLAGANPSSYKQPPQLPTLITYAAARIPRKLYLCDTAGSSVNQVCMQYSGHWHHRGMAVVCPVVLLD